MPSRLTVNGATTGYPNRGPVRSTSAAGGCRVRLAAAGRAAIGGACRQATPNVEGAVGPVAEGGSTMCHGWGEQGVPGICPTRPSDIYRRLSKKANQSVFFSYLRIVPPGCPAGSYCGDESGLCVSSFRENSASLPGIFRMAGVRRRRADVSRLPRDSARCRVQQLLYRRIGQNPGGPTELPLLGGLPPRSALGRPGAPAWAGAVGAVGASPAGPGRAGSVPCRSAGAPTRHAGHLCWLD